MKKGQSVWTRESGPSQTKRKHEGSEGGVTLPRGGVNVGGKGSVKKDRKMDLSELLYVRKQKTAAATNGSLHSLSKKKKKDVEREKIELRYRGGPVSRKLPRVASALEGGGVKGRIGRSTR